MKSVNPVEAVRLGCLGNTRQFFIGIMYIRNWDNNEKTGDK